jgi:nucleotide-binding universal stress UspA family protein
MKVLIAIDEISCAREVVRFVTEHNWEKGTEFRLIHVVSPIMMDAPLASYPAFLESISQAAQEDGRHILRTTAKPITEKLKDVVLQTDVIIGYPPQIVLSEAKQWQSDLIVLGSHGRKGVEKFFYGSVSNDVAAAATCSVLVLKLPHVEEVKEKVTSNAQPAVAAV